MTNYYSNCSSGSYNFDPILSCEHKSFSNMSAKLFWNNSNALNPINCGDAGYIDTNRFQDITYSLISSPQGAFNMEFWFYSQSYVNTSGSNFGSFEITWNKHVKIIMQNNSGVLTGYCYPVVDKSIPANDPTPITVIYPTMNGTPWNYISCGVDPSLSQFFITKTPFLINASGYTSVNTIPSAQVTLFFSEKSITSYGQTFFANLRLWSCYSCNASSIYL